MDLESIDEEAKLTPAAIVAELDKHIIAQAEAKRSVAIALRNRYRRRLVPEDLQDEIYPKNILMIGNTGIGKTEIARRLARLVGAPFIKVEATKFSQIGYVGRDVESIIRDLMAHAVHTERLQMLKSLETKAKAEVTEVILDALLPESAAALKRSPTTQTSPLDTLSMSLPMSGAPGAPNKPSPTSLNDVNQPPPNPDQFIQTREKLKARLLAGELEEKFIEILLTPNEPNPSGGGLNVSGLNLNDQQMGALGGIMKNLGNVFQTKKVKQRTMIKDARPLLLEQIAENMLDMNRVITHAKQKTETMGIVFIDEIDKIVSKASETRGNLDVSKEGVQRDILPLVEGSAVSTPHGMVKTDHILFIAAGAFHISSPSDMIPELQGRFPIRVKLKPLKAEELEAILVQPKSALIKQYQALLATESIELQFSPEAISEIAKTAELVNTESENIGARRLATLMEKLLADILFHGQTFKKLSLLQNLKSKNNTVTIDKAYVIEQFQDIIPDKDLSRYIL